MRQQDELEDDEVVEDLAAKLKRLNEEEGEEMSEEELERQAAEKEYYNRRRFMEQLGQEEVLKRYTNVVSKQKQEADAIDQFLVDMSSQ